MPYYFLDPCGRYIGLLVIFVVFQGHAFITFAKVGRDARETVRRGGCNGSATTMTRAVATLGLLAASAVTTVVYSVAFGFLRFQYG